MPAVGPWCWRRRDPLLADSYAELLDCVAGLRRGDVASVDMLRAVPQQFVDMLGADGDVQALGKRLVSALLFKLKYLFASIDRRARGILKNFKLSGSFSPLSGCFSQWPVPG